MFGIASSYQMAHGLGLLGVAWLASRQRGVWLTAPNVAGAAFALGILLFSGLAVLVRADQARAGGGLGSDGRLLADVQVAGGNVERYPASPIEMRTSPQSKRSGCLAA